MKCQMCSVFFGFAAAACPMCSVEKHYEKTDKMCVNSEDSAYNTLTACLLVISEDLMVNHFLPGLKCLRADMEHLSPEHEVSSCVYKLSLRCRWQQKLKCNGI